jgi:hypothetical protein
MAGRGPHWNQHVWSRDAEYAADLWLIAKRSLDRRERLIYCEYLLQQQPWTVVGPLTKLNRGQFFHSVYRIESKLGRGLLEAGIFPPHNYFAGTYHAGLYNPADTEGIYRRGGSESEVRLPLTGDKGFRRTAV